MERHPAARHVDQLLDQGEQIRHLTDAGDTVLAVTDRRVAIADEQHVQLVTPYEGLRRIQFDIERDIPATLVIVPDSPWQPPRVLAVPPAQYEAVAQALAYIGRRLASS